MFKTNDNEPKPMNTIEKGITGQIYQCIRSNRKQGTVKGKHYVYDSGCLSTYTTRNVTQLINGDYLLSTKAFSHSIICPFCHTTHPNVTAIGAEPHDAVECAAEWDAKVKNYER